MITSADEFVRLRTSTEEEDYRRAATEEASEAVWRSVIARFPDMRMWVVLNKTVPPEMIAELASDGDAAVRSTVARTRRTPVEALRRLAGDEDAAVRLAVATNPKTPREILESLSGDAWDAVREVVSKRLGL